MNPVQEVMLPLDFTPKNHDALTTVLQLAVPDETRVTLFHVVEGLATSDQEQLADFYKTLREKALERLEEYAEVFREAGIEVNLQVRVGKPAREIVTAASVQGISLIVLSSHALGETGGAGSWATVSYQVSVFCRCSVLLVK